MMQTLLFLLALFEAAVCKRSIPIDVNKNPEEMG